MKKFILFAFTLAVMVSCTEPVKQYTTSSPEIETIKTLHEYFKDSNYDGLKDLYAEDAEIYENSLEPTAVSDMIQQGKEGRKVVEGYDFPEGVKCEMITNDAGEKWVNSWAVWSGNIKGSETEIKVPIISRFLFKDGKIVKEYSYWDNLPSYNAFEELASEKLDNLEETLEADQ
ncbi:nuclear transport factor 2 family protein [Formosa sp. 3Alg 14/1]|uniref:nuclear transport factor 2 family protein n=1 Tax=unclassified Formosa TaxID=2644710 RepID=UPI0039BE2F6C